MNLAYIRGLKHPCGKRPFALRRPFTNLEELQLLDKPVSQTGSSLQTYEHIVGTKAFKTTN